MILAAYLLALVLGLALGAALCFVGYRFFLVMLPIWGFFAGLWLGAYTVTAIFGTGFLSTATGLVAGIVVGVICAVLSYRFYQVGVAIVAAAIGAALGSGIMTALGFDPGFLVTIVAIVSALVAVGLTLLLNLQKYVIIALSAFAGADLIVLSGLILVGRITLDQVQHSGNLLRPIIQDSWLWLIAWLVLVVAGIVVQIRANRMYAFTQEMYVEGWG
jgi:hypothetical protein